VPFKQIEANGFNLDIKNPNAPEDAVGDPDDLLAQYKALLDDVAKTRDALKEALADALIGGR